MITPQSETLLRGLIEQVEQLQHSDSHQLNQLLIRAQMILRRTFGEQSDYLRNLAALSFDPGIYPTTEQVRLQSWTSGYRSFLSILKTALEEATLFANDGTTSNQRTDEPSLASRRVFLVHGRDEGMKQTVARTLEKLDLDPIVLHEQPNKGRTIIEKFEDYADVSFAVVVLTPDDMAYVRGAKPSTAKPRARQNVILELGFFNRTARKTERCRPTQRR